MKTYLTRNEAAEMLDVTPQTISNYVSKGLLAESKTKDTGAKQMKILRSSVEKLLNEGYDIPTQSRAIDSFREELSKEEDELRKQKKRIKELREIVDISEKFNRNISEVAEILASSLVNNNILSRRESFIVAELLSGSNFEYLSDRLGVSSKRIKQIYNKTLKLLSLGKETSYMQLLEENRILKKDLKREREKTSALETRLESLDKQRSACPDGVIRIPHQLTGYESLENVSARLYNVLKTNGIDNLYDLALTRKQKIYRTRNFGRKSKTELEDLMNSLGIRFNDISSLQNDIIASMPGPFVEIPLYDLQERQKKLQND